MRLLLVLWLVLLATFPACGADIGSPIPIPLDVASNHPESPNSSPRGRLLLREVYDVNGVKLVLEETTSSGGTQTAATTKQASKKGTTCERCGPLCECGPDGCRCTSAAWHRSCKAAPAIEVARHDRQQATTTVIRSTYQPMPMMTQPYYGSFSGGFQGGACAGGSCGAGG